MKLADLKRYDLIYVGTPYTKYPGSIHHAFLDAVKVTEQLLRVGLLNVYSPIVHSHSLAIYGNLDPLDHSIWLPFNNAIMDKSAAMLVAMMTGWESSTGVLHEIRSFVGAGKSVYFLNPADLSVEPISAPEREQFLLAGRAA